MSIQHICIRAIKVWEHSCRPIVLPLVQMAAVSQLFRAGTHGEISFDSVDSRSSSVYVNVNYSHEHTVNS